MTTPHLQNVSHLPLTSLSSALSGQPAGLADPDASALLDGSTLTLSMPTALAAGGMVIDTEKGLIKNVAIMSVGPALGHGFDLDQTSLSTLIAAYNANKAALKVRFTHPGWTSDGIECLMGIPQNFRLEGDIVRGDIQLGQYAKISPKGNLWNYVLAIAAEHPALIGLSIVARFNFEPVVDAKTGETKQYLGRVKYLQAVDFVGDPAANRNGLLSDPSANPQTADNVIPHHPQGRENNMNKKLRTYLQSLGLNTNATDAQAIAYWHRLAGEQRGQADALATQPDSASQNGNTPGQGDENTNPPSNLNAQGNPTPAPQNANTPAPVTPPASQGLTSADVDRATQAALSAERQRLSLIQSLARNHNLDADWVQRHTADGTEEAALQRDVLATLAHRVPAITGLGGHSATGGEDGRVAHFTGMRHAIMLRAGLTVEQPHELHRDYLHLGLVESGRQHLQRLGVRDVYGMAPETIARICLSRMELAGHIGSVALSHTTSDFPSLLGDVINRVLTDAYQQEPSTCEAWSSEMLLNDFRETKMVTLGGVGLPQRVREGGEYQYGTFGEKGETIAALKYGLLIAMTWEMFVNDDLGGFTTQTLDFGGACRALENDIMYGLLTSNPTLAEDNTAVFHGDHNNLNEDGEGVLSITTLSQMRAAMRKQKGIAPNATTPGRTLALMPTTLLVPEALADQASQLVASTVVPGGTNATPTYKFVNSLTLVSDPRLDENSDSKFYLKAANRAGGAVRAYLRNHRQPYIESQAMPVNMDGIVYKCRHVVGGKLTDFRTWQTNDGEAQEG